jgi:hypothetical protein
VPPAVLSGAKIASGAVVFGPNLGPKPGGRAIMPGQHIWRIRVRRVGEADFQIADIQLHRRRAPVSGEVIDAMLNRDDMAKRKNIRARIINFHEFGSGGTTAYEIYAVEEDDGDPNPDIRHE